MSKKSYAETSYLQHATHGFGEFPITNTMVPSGNLPRNGKSLRYENEVSMWSQKNDSQWRLFPTPNCDSNAFSEPNTMFWKPIECSSKRNYSGLSTRLGSWNPDPFWDRGRLKNPKSKKQTAPRACPKYLTTSFERSTYNYQNCWCPNMNSSCPWSKMKFRVTPYKIVVARGCILFQYSASTPYDFIRVTNPYDATELYSQIPTPTLLDFSRITPKPSRTQVSVPVSVSVMAATEKKKK